MLLCVRPAVSRQCAKNFLDVEAAVRSNKQQRADGRNENLKPGGEGD